MGNLEPFLNHFGIVFRHLEQLFHIFEASVLEGPMASKTHTQSSRSERFFYAWKSLFLLVFGFTFWPLFDQVLDTFGCLFGCLLGAFSGLLRFSWEPLDPKTLKNLWFFKVFENAPFGLFEAPDGSLGLILLLLGQIWSQDGGTKWVAKVVF